MYINVKYRCMPNWMVRNQRAGEGSLAKFKRFINRQYYFNKVHNEELGDEGCC